MKRSPIHYWGNLLSSFEHSTYGSLAPDPPCGLHADLCGLQRLPQNHQHPPKFHTATSALNYLVIPGTTEQNGHRVSLRPEPTIRAMTPGPADVSTGVYVRLLAKQQSTHCDTTVQMCKHCLSP